MAMPEMWRPICCSRAGRQGTRLNPSPSSIIANRPLDSWLSDPRETTRDLMKQMEADLGTKLDWITVDHHNTGHPHTHIIVRGVTDDGKTLNIAGDIGRSRITRGFCGHSYDLM
jgi:hypothetical protein